MKYHVTGVDRDGKRFKMVYNSYMQAMCINMWQGTVWEVNESGKRKAIKRVWN